MRGALWASYSEKREPKNLPVDVELDSCSTCGECVAILEKPLRMPQADLLDASGQGAFAAPGLSHPSPSGVDHKERRCPYGPASYSCVLACCPLVPY